MTATIRDAVVLLERMVGRCPEGPREHSWRKCPRCGTIALVQDGDPKALQRLRAAIEELKKQEQ